MSKPELTDEDLDRVIEWELQMSIKNDGLVNPLATWFFEQKAKKGMSREKLAHELGVTTTFMTAFLNGGYPNIKFSLLDRILKLTGISYEAMATYLREAVERAEAIREKEKAAKEG